MAGTVKVLCYKSKTLSNGKKTGGGGGSRYLRLVRMVDCRIMLIFGYGNYRSAA